ncbi:MAG: SirB2 family protein [Burkholderiales bacterium]|nr:SirB2 family protein [Burkholderiales bacterium]
MRADYTVLHHLHVACVAVSGAGFALRGFWMLRRSPLLGARWVRIAPHVVDTALLASAVALALLIAQYPFVHAWLTAKVVALAAYIVAGSVALRRGPTRTVRTIALVAALAAYAYIIAVALTRSPLPWST